MTTTHTVKAIALAPGLKQSSVVSAAYTCTPGWPMLHHDSRRTGLSTVDTSATLGVLIWKFTTSSAVHYGPATGADGTVYVGSLDKSLYSVKPDGTLKWKFSTTGGILESPAIGPDSTIYFGSYDNNLYALNPGGSLKWKFTIPGIPTPGVVSSPAIGADGTIYVGWDDGDYTKPGSGGLYAVGADGILKWKFVGGGYEYFVPAIGADGTVYVGGDKGLYALTSQGTLRWSDIVAKLTAVAVMKSSTAFRLVRSNLSRASVNFGLLLDKSGVEEFRSALTAVCRDARSLQ